MTTLWSLWPWNDCWWLKSWLKRKHTHKKHPVSCSPVRGNTLLIREIKYQTVITQIIILYNHDEQKTISKRKTHWTLRWMRYKSRSLWVSLLRTGISVVQWPKLERLQSKCYLMFINLHLGCVLRGLWMQNFNKPTLWWFVGYWSSTRSCRHLAVIIRRSF